MTTPAASAVDQVPALLAATAVAGRSEPLFTYCDESTGERAELSAEQLTDWVARTAQLLTGECRLEPGARAAVALPSHWQSAAVLLGCWAAGLSVHYRSWATAGLPQIEPGAAGPFDVSFITRGRLDSILEDPPAATHKFALGPGPQAPPEYRDYLTEVRGLPAAFATGPVRPTDPASVDGTTYQQWGQVAREVAAERGIAPGDRVLVDAAAHDHPLTWLLAPLSAGASVVLYANLAPGSAEQRAAAERASRVL